MHGTRGPVSLVLALTASVALALAGPGGAQAARFQLSFHSTDTLDWNVATPQTCGRTGNGTQVVEVHSLRPLTVTAAIESLPGGGKGLVILHGTSGPSLTSTGTVERTDDTVGSYIGPDGSCLPIPPKDCGTKPLQNFPTYVSAEPGNRLSLDGLYWNTLPFSNCIALQTPIPTEDPHSGKVFLYTGWVFGNEYLGLPDKPTTVASTPVAPQKLKRGHTYKFRARRVFRLSDSDLNRHAVIDSNGGDSGPIGTTDNTLGGGRSIVDTLSWTVTLKRVS